MQFYTEPQRDIPILFETDVLVAGSGPAGLGAALRAGRLGAKTLLLEEQGCPGGVATAGLMSNWGGKSSSKILKEIIARSMAFESPPPEEQSIINHVRLKNLLFNMLDEANVKLLLYTKACDMVMENGRVRGVVVENKDGRGLILAKTVVDATGDGDLAARAKVPFIKGRETDGKMQPCTLMFKVGGVDESRAVFPESFESLVYTEKGELQALARQILPFPAGHVLLYETTLPGIVCCNMTNCIDVDGTSAESLTKGAKVCYSQLDPIVEFLRDYVPGYEKCFLVSDASLLGIRETRHFQGHYTLSKEDILEARIHEDWVVREAFFNFDVHNMSGPSLDETGIQEQWQQKNTYTIPYGCLLPMGVEGLLLSGRNISGSHLAHSNFRIMSVCMALGEAAGAAAFLATSRGCSLAAVPPQDIQALV